MDLQGRRGERRRNKDHERASAIPPGQGTREHFDSTNRRNEESTLHNHLANSEWKDMLGYINRLRHQDQACIEHVLSALDERGATPIHTAVWKAPIALTKLLISVIPLSIRESLLLQQDIDGNTPLHLACANLEVLESDGMFDSSVILILGSAATEAHQVKNLLGDTPLHLLLSSPAFQAEENNFKLEAAAETLLRSIWTVGARSSLSQNSAGASLLHVAAAHGTHERVFLLLLELVPEICKIADKAGMLPLHYLSACINSIPRADVASKVVAAYPRSVVHQCNTGDTPLHLFVSNARENIEKEKRELRNTLKLAEILLGPGDDPSLCPLLIKNRDSLSPLHCCSLFSCPSTITRTVMTSPFAAEASSLTDSNQATPLHLACASSSVGSSVKQVEILGMANSQARMASISRDCRDMTPMHIAAENPKATKHLVKALAEINSKAASMEISSRKLMPLHVAIRRCADASIIRALLKIYPGAARVMFNGDQTVLHDACRYNLSASSIRALIKSYPISTEKQDKHGNLPLHIAVAYKAPVDVIQVLIHAFPGAAMVQNLLKNVPLHFAAGYKESAESTKFLLQSAPQSTLVVNVDGQSPLDRAEVSNIDPDVLNLMKEKAKEAAGKLLPSSSSCQDDQSLNDHKETNMEVSKPAVALENRIPERSKPKSAGSSRPRYNRSTLRFDSASPSTIALSRRHSGTSSGSQQPYSPNKPRGSRSLSSQRRRRSSSASRRPRSTSDSRRFRNAVASRSSERSSNRRESRRRPTSLDPTISQRRRQSYSRAESILNQKPRSEPDIKRAMM